MLVGLNDRNCACQITGFMPIHAVVANGLTSTYDWMCDLPGLAAYKRAKVDQRTQVRPRRTPAHACMHAPRACRATAPNAPLTHAHRTRGRWAA